MITGFLLILLVAVIWLCCVQQAEIASLTRALTYSEAQRRHPSRRAVTDRE